MISPVARPSNCTTGFDDSTRKVAIDALAVHQLEAGAPRRQPRAEALVENLMTDWLKLHVDNLLDPVRYANSVDHWRKFFELERTAGRLTGALTVADLTPQLQARFRSWRAEGGVGGHTISRDLAALRGALNWAWKNQRLEHAPFIADVPPHQKAPARDRVLTFEEIAAILDKCVGRPTGSTSSDLSWSSSARPAAPTRCFS